MSQVISQASQSKVRAGGDDGRKVHSTVRAWIDECVSLCKPDQLYWCDGSDEERQALLEQGLRDGVFIKLNPQKLPNCYLHRSNANDVARSEHLTYICTPSEDMAGPTNNWMDDKQGYAKLRGLFAGCMRGRTMYVVPFVMGPVGSALAKVGVELTDSLYVAVSMGMMTRMGEVAWEQLGETPSPTGPVDTAAHAPDFTRCLHSVGDVNPDRRYICHFPLDNTIWSFGSGYGGNALLARNVSPCGSPVIWVTARAGWRSTCCSWAPKRPMGRRATLPPPFPAAAARRISPC